MGLQRPSQTVDLDEGLDRPGVRRIVQEFVRGEHAPGQARGLVLVAHRRHAPRVVGAPHFAQAAEGIVAVAHDLAVGRTGRHASPRSRLRARCGAARPLSAGRPLSTRRPMLRPHALIAIAHFVARCSPCLFGAHRIAPNSSLLRGSGGLRHPHSSLYVHGPRWSSLSLTEFRPTREGRVSTPIYIFRFSPI